MPLSMQVNLVLQPYSFLNYLRLVGKVNTFLGGETGKLSVSRLFTLSL